MTGREKELERVLTDLDRTGDEELDALVDTAEDLTTRFAVAPPGRPEARAMFIEGVGARKRSALSSLAVPGLAVAILLLSVAALGRGALPGESLYPVRNVLRSAGLADAPDEDIQREIDDAVLLIGRARVASEGDLPHAERFAVAALMSLGRAEGYLDEVGADDRTFYAGRIDSLRARAIALLRSTLDGNDGSRSGSDDSAGDDSSGSDSGSDDSGSDDGSGSGSGSDDSAGDESSGSGSDDSGSDDGSGSGSDDSGDSSGSGSDDSEGSGSEDDN